MIFHDGKEWEDKEGKRKGKFAGVISPAAQEGDQLQHKIFHGTKPS